MHDETILDDEDYRPKPELADITQINLWINELNRYVSYIRLGRVALICMTILTILPLFGWLSAERTGPIDLDVMELYLLLPMAFACCALFVRQSAFTAHAVGLVIILNNLVSFEPVDNQTESIKLVLTIVIVFFLIRGLNGAFQIKRLLKTLENNGVSGEIEEQVRRLKKVPPLS